MIKTELGHDVPLQKLIMFGKVMTDEKKFGELNVKDGDFMVLMVAKAKAPPKAVEPAPPAPVPAPVPAYVPQPPVAAPPATDTLPPTEVIQRDAPVVPPTVPVDPGTAVGAESNLVTGNEADAVVDNIAEMGFPKEDVRKALRAAFGNPERAIEYLTTGIPGDLGTAPPPPPPAPLGPTGGGTGQPPNPFAAMGMGGGMPGGIGAAGAPGAGGGAGAPGAPGMPGMPDLAALASNPAFQDLRMRIMQDPNVLQQVLAGLAQTQPQLYQAIQANPQAFLQLLMGAGGGAGGAPGQGRGGGPGVIQVSAQEKASIDNLKGMGFSEMQAAEAYFACDKNEEMAANFLFDNAEAWKQEDALEEALHRSQAEGGTAPVVPQVPPAAPVTVPPAAPPVPIPPPAAEAPMGDIPPAAEEPVQDPPAAPMEDVPPPAAPMEDVPPPPPPAPQGDKPDEDEGIYIIYIYIYRRVQLSSTKG